MPSHLGTSQWGMEVRSRVPQLQGLVHRWCSLLSDVPLIPTPQMTPLKSRPLLPHTRGWPFSGRVFQREANVQLLALGFCLGLFSAQKVLVGSSLMTVLVLGGVCLVSLYLGCCSSQCHACLDKAVSPEWPFPITLSTSLF